MLLGSATGGSAATYARLALGYREGGVTTRRLAGTPAITMESPRAPQGGTGSHSHLLHGHLQNASGSS